MATSEKKLVSPAEKISIWHCAAVFFSQKPKKCTNLDLGLLYILILEFMANSLGKINFLRSAFNQNRAKSSFTKPREARFHKTANF